MNRILKILDSVCEWLMRASTWIAIIFISLMMAAKVHCQTTFNQVRISTDTIERITMVSIIGDSTIISWDNTTLIFQPHQADMIESSIRTYQEEGYPCTIVMLQYIPRLYDSTLGCGFTLYRKEIALGPPDPKRINRPVMARN